MAEDQKQVINVTAKSPELFGGAWLAGWLFTIGYLKLTFWKGVFAVIIWPYFIGGHVAGRW